MKKLLLLLLLHPFSGLFSGTTWVSRYQKGKTSLDLNEATADGAIKRVCVCVRFNSIRVMWPNKKGRACQKTSASLKSHSPADGDLGPGLPSCRSRWKNSARFTDASVCSWGSAGCTVHSRYWTRTHEHTNTHTHTHNTSRFLSTLAIQPLACAGRSVVSFDFVGLSIYTQFKTAWAINIKFCRDIW